MFLSEIRYKFVGHCRLRDQQSWRCSARSRAPA